MSINEQKLHTTGMDLTNMMSSNSNKKPDTKYIIYDFIYLVFKIGQN